MLKLNVQYSSHLIRRAGSLEKTLMLRKIEGRRRMGWQRMRWLDDSITESMNMNLSRLWEIAEDRGAWYASVHEASESQTRLSNWTTAASVACSVTHNSITISRCKATALMLSKSYLNDPNGQKELKTTDHHIYNLSWKHFETHALDQLFVFLSKLVIAKYLLTLKLSRYSVQIGDHTLLKWFHSQHLALSSSFSAIRCNKPGVGMGREEPRISFLGCLNDSKQNSNISKISIGLSG